MEGDFIWSNSQLMTKAKRPRDDQTPTQWGETEFRATKDTANDLELLLHELHLLLDWRQLFLAILDQKLLLQDDIGMIQELQSSHYELLAHITNEMSHMNTWIGRITCCQSKLGGFAQSLERDSPVTTFASGDDDDASASTSADEMTNSQCSTFVHHDKKEQLQSRQASCQEESAYFEGCSEDNCIEQELSHVLKVFVNLSHTFELI